MLDLLFYVLHWFSPSAAAHLLWLVQQGPSICQTALPAGPSRQLYEAIVCGIRLPAGENQQLFVQTGLIHMMVVSGAHLSVVEEALGAILPWGVQPFLGFYSFLTGLQPPVIRALFRKWTRMSNRETWGFSALQMEMALSIMILFLHPPWLFSRSFLMSWMCGIAISLPRWFKHADMTVKCYLFLIPFCWISPLAIGWNLLVVPAVALVLFPLSLLIVILPPLQLITDPGWRLLLWILREGPKGPALPVFVSTTNLIMLTIVVHLFFIFGETEWRRASAFSLS